MKYRLLFLVICILSIVIIPACNTASTVSENKPEKLNIAFQYGMAYAPMLVMREQNLIEKYYGKDIEISWQTLNSGSAINEGIISGSIDIGAMGVAPAIIGIVKGIPYKIFSNFSSQPNVIMVQNTEIESLKDIKPENKIALVNIGSIQHILLSMAAKSELGDSHALDNNIVAMSHPDGMASLLAGSVDCQLTTSPYVFKEREEGIGEIESIEKIWPNGNSFIVGVASQKLHDNNPELYAAIVDALQEALDYLSTQKDSAADLLCTGENVSKETMLEWLNDPACLYSSETKGIMEMAQFMAEEGSIDEMPGNFSDFAYSNVKGN